MPIKPPAPKKATRRNAPARQHKPGLELVPSPPPSTRADGRGRPIGSYQERQYLINLETGEETDEYIDVWVPPEHQRCTATVRASMNPRRGYRCARTRIKGGKVCVAHGGSLPGVKRAAQKRLAIAALPAAEKLIEIALKKRGVSDADRIKAILAILDRAGVQGRATIEVELKPWQQLLQNALGATAIEAGDDSGVLEAEEGKDYWLPEDDEEEDE